MAKAQQEGAGSTPGTGLSLAMTAVIATVAIANLGNTIASPLVPLIRADFGATAAEVGFVVSGFGLGRLLMDIPAGYLVDRYPITYLFGFGILLAAAASAGAAFSSTLLQLTACRTIMGIGCATMSTVALVILVDMAGIEHRGEVLAYYTTVLLFAQAIAPIIGGFVATIFDWRMAFLLCAVTPLASIPMNLFATSKMKMSPRSGKASHGHPGKHGKHGMAVGAPPESMNWPALIVTYLSSFANFFNRQAMRQSLLPLYGGMVLALNSSTIGTILTLGSIGTMVIALPCGRLADRIGRKPLLIPGLTVLGLGNMALFLGQDQFWFTVATVMVSMGVLANSMQSGLVADLLPEKYMGRGIGLYRFVADLGMLMGPIALGMVVDTFGFSSALVAGGVVVAIGLLTVIAFIPRRTATVTPTTTS